LQSLKKADCGIAVEGASDAARSAADVVFLDEGLSSIVTSFKVARQIFHRLKAYIIYRASLDLVSGRYDHLADIRFLPPSTQESLSASISQVSTLASTDQPSSDENLDCPSTGGLPDAVGHHHQRGHSS
jgi:hypothetical protein